uniref:SKA2 domain-containing protein n=1 Tax=Haemonchus contortus TaxID=6289 RepID=A0A7I4YWU5_HAECO
MSREVNANLKLVSDTLEKMARTADQTAEMLSEEEQKQIEEYVERTHELLEKAYSLANRLEARLTGLEARSESSGEMRSARVELPTIPIPSFSGKISEFENFWALFDANVHSQRLTNLQKLNYLLQSLRGEAKEAIRRYAVTEENYTAAVEILRTKFGDKSKLIYNLQVRLERASATSTHISEQRRLLEYLLALTTQLEQKGVSLNGSFTIQKILAKFKQSLQRKILQQRFETDHREDDWSMSY